MSVQAEVLPLVGLPVALGLGLLYGMGPCLVSCLPYLGPVFLASDGGIRRSWRVLLPLSLGRLTVYGGFGAISGWWGSRFVGGVTDWVIHLVVGLAGVLVGWALFLRRQRPAGCSGSPMAAEAPLHFQRRATTPPDHLPFGLYLMGMGLALTPCAPQGVVLASAAASGSPLLGAGFGLLFGAGALLAPAVVYGLAAAYIGQQLRRQLGAWLGRLERLSAALLVLVGSSELFKVGRYWW